MSCSYLRGNSLGNEGCKNLAIYLSNNQVLKKFSLQADLSISGALSWNVMGQFYISFVDDGVLALTDSVASHPTLENLNLSCMLRSGILIALVSHM